MILIYMCILFNVDLSINRHQLVNVMQAKQQNENHEDLESGICRTRFVSTERKQERVLFAK